MKPKSDLLDPALRSALNHLNWNKGRGDVGRISFNAKGEGYAKRYYLHRFPDSFKFRFTIKENPARVTVRALGSTRTELFENPARVTVRALGSTRTELFQIVNLVPENRR